MNCSRGARRILSLAVVAMLTMMAGSASATLPGKNGPLLVSSFVKQQSLNYSTYLFIQPLAGKARKLIGTPEFSYSDAAVSPNGRQIVYSRYPGYQLWLGPARKPGKARAITAPDPDLNNGDSLFAPDGKSIYYSATYYTGAGVGWHLRRYFIKSKKTRNYKVNRQLDGGLTDVSPDGRLLAYERGGDDHESVIRFMDTGTGKSRKFRFRYPTGNANFSPDGKSIVFIAYVKDSPEVFMSRLDGRRARRLTRGKEINYIPVFSPDGRQVAFTQGPEARKRIGIITLKTGRTRFIKAPGDYTEVEQWLAR